MIVNFIAYFLICLFFFLSEIIKTNNSMSTHSKQVVLETDELSLTKEKNVCASK